MTRMPGTPTRMILIATNKERQSNINTLVNLAPEFSEDEPPELACFRLMLRMSPERRFACGLPLRSVQGWDSEIRQSRSYAAGRCLNSALGH